MATNKYTELELMQARIEHVPADWLFTTIGKSYSIKNNLRKPINETERSKRQGPYPYYGPTKIQDYISTYEQDGSYVLIGEDGDHFLKYKDQCMTQLVDGKCTVNNHAHIIEGKKDASREWFYYYFMHRDIFSFLSRQGAGRYKLNKASLEKIPLLLPPLQEQQKIAVILSTWDKAIETTEKLINNSQMQKRALMQQLLTGKKRLLDENGVRFSGKWEKVPLSSKIIFSNLKSTKKNEYPIITSSRKGIFLQEDYFKKQVASENNIGYKVVPRDYITYRSMSDDGIFVFNKQTILDTAIISPAYGVFKFINLDASFGLYAINSKHMMGKINTFSQGGTRIALKTSVLSNIKIHIPSLLEQKKIAEVISSADREIELLQAKLEHLKQEKKALMQQLLTGKRRVVIN